MSHGCHTCGCPNGCECNDYSYTVGQWLQVRESVQISSALAELSPGLRFTLDTNYRPDHCSAREYRSGKAWYQIHGYWWPEYALRPGDQSRIPPENPDHVCGMYCDGQDGSNSDCGRRRANARIALEQPQKSYVVQLNATRFHSGASKGSPAQLVVGKLGYTVGEPKRESHYGNRPGWRVRVPELDGHRECDDRTRQMEVTWPHEALTFLSERDPEPLAPLRRAHELQEAAHGRPAARLTGSAAEIARATKPKPSEAPPDEELSRFKLLEID